MPSRSAFRALVSAVLAGTMACSVSLLAPSAQASPAEERSSKSVMVMAPIGESFGSEVTVKTSFWSDALPVQCRQRNYVYKNGQQTVPGTLCRYVADWRYQLPGKPWSAWGTYWDSDGKWVESDKPGQRVIYGSHERLQFTFATRGGPMVAGAKLQVRIRGWQISRTGQTKWIGSGVSPESVWDGEVVRPVDAESPGSVTKIMMPLRMDFPDEKSFLTVEVDFYSNVLTDACLFNFPAYGDPWPEDWTGWGYRCAYITYWRYQNPGGAWSKWGPALNVEGDTPPEWLRPTRADRMSSTVAVQLGPQVRRGAQIQAQIRVWEARDNSYKWGASWDSPILKTK